MRLRESVAAALVLSASSMALGREAAPPAAEGLRASLVSLDAELDKLMSREEAERAAWEDERPGLARRRDKLAGAVVELGFERERLLRRRERLAASAAQARDMTEAIETSLSSAMSRLAALRDRMDLHLAESPDRAAFGLPNSMAGVEVAERAHSSERAAEWLAIFDCLHARAGEVDILRTTVHLADGSPAEARLLSVGRQSFAYLTEDDRLGFALASPAEASGFRWTEVRDRSTRRRLQAVFDAEGSGGPLAVPMDVTGMIRADVSRPSGLASTLREGGFVMIPLVAVAALAMALTLERVWFLSRAGRGGERLAAAIITSSRSREWLKAEALARADGVVPRVLDACLRRRSKGIHAVEDGIQEQLLHEAPRLERFLSGIAMLGAIAPLLGLLGTVTGIISTFESITVFGSAQPGAMAGGISEALITTAAGLTIAIPILVAHSLLSGKADRLLADAERYAATMLNLFQEFEQAGPSAPAECAEEELP